MTLCISSKNYTQNVSPTSGYQDNTISIDTGKSIVLTNGSFLEGGCNFFEKLNHGSFILDKSGSWNAVKNDADRKLRSTVPQRPSSTVAWEMRSKAIRELKAEIDVLKFSLQKLMNEMEAVGMLRKDSRYSSYFEPRVEECKSLQAQIAERESELQSLGGEDAAEIEYPMGGAHSEQSRLQRSIAAVKQWTARNLIKRKADGNACAIAEHQRPKAQYSEVASQVPTKAGAVGAISSDFNASSSRVGINCDTPTSNERVYEPAEVCTDARVVIGAAKNTREFIKVEDFVKDTGSEIRRLAEEERLRNVEEAMLSIKEVQLSSLNKKPHAMRFRKNVAAELKLHFEQL